MSKIDFRYGTLPDGSELLYIRKQLEEHGVDPDAEWSDHWRQRESGVDLLEWAITFWDIQRKFLEKAA